MEDSPILPNKPNPNTYIQLDLDGNGNQAIGKAIDSTIVNFGGNGQVINVTVNDRIPAPLIPPSNIVEQQLTYEEDRQRRVLLNRVKEDWVEGVLEKSLHERVSIELGLEKRPKLVKKTFSDVDEFVDAPGQALPEGTSVNTVFDRMGSGRTLLIVGEPGAGKTIALLKVAKDVIARTKPDLRQQIPVVFNLSSWARKPQSIEKWLIQELLERYQVPKDVGGKWVKSEALMLFLDGLDEVKAERRDACVEALNQFMQTHGTTEIVICCRIRDYDGLQDKLTLRGAICIQPLTVAQIDLYFEQAGDRLSALKAVLSQDEEFQKLAKSPLMLSVMSLAYKDFKPEHLTVGGTIEDYRKRLFNTYIDRIFERRRMTHKYSRKDSQRWLIWLAQQMKVTSQSQFLIEGLQPSWLSNQRQIPFEDPFDTLFKGVAFKDSFKNLLKDLWNSVLWSKDLFKDIQKNPESDVYAGLIFSMINWLTFAVIFGGFKELNSATPDVFERYIHFYIKSFYTVFLIGAFYFCFVKLFLNNIKPVGSIKWSWQEVRNNLPSFVSKGLIFGRNSGLFFGINGLFYGGLFSGVKLGLSAGLLTGLFGGLIYGLIYGLLGGLLGGLFGGLIFYVLGGLTIGFQGTEIQHKQKPNQGIFRSALNGVMIGISSSLIIGVPTGMFFGVSNGKFFGVFGGELLGLIFGGNAVLRHFALRFTLYRKRYTPWNYARFLDYATERLFMQKVGGGYIFIHRMLLEHFAEISIEQK
jgi:NACHT domain